MKELSHKKYNYKKWLSLINIPFQMGIIIYLFSLLGKWLDIKYEKPDSIFVKIFTLIGVFIALFNVIKQVKKLNNEEKN